VGPFVAQGFRAPADLEKVLPVAFLEAQRDVAQAKVEAAGRTAIHGNVSKLADLVATPMLAKGRCRSHPRRLLVLKMKLNFNFIFDHRRLPKTPGLCQEVLKLEFNFILA
jgi:hypothetical protein